MLSQPVFCASKVERKADGNAYFAQFCRCQSGNKGANLPFRYRLDMITIGHARLRHTFIIPE